MLRSVTLEDPLSIGYSEILEMEEAMWIVFANKLYKPKERVSDIKNISVTDVMFTCR